MTVLYVDFHASAGSIAVTMCLAYSNATDIYVTMCHQTTP